MVNSSIYICITRDRSNPSTIFSYYIKTSIFFISMSFPSWFIFPYYAHDFILSFAYVYDKQPLEDGTIDITRNGIYHKFPADFQLIATMNPCPCGYGLEDGICRCTYHEKKRYLKKLSGPILDRFDMVLCLSKKEADTQKIQKESQETSNQIKERIETTIQREKKLLKNYQCSDTSHLSHIQLNKLLHLSKECKEILDIAYRSGKITRRGMDKILKVALTIMLMENESEIKPIHLMEAMTFRNTGFIKEVLEYGR